MRIVGSRVMPCVFFTRQTPFWCILADQTAAGGCAILGDATITHAEHGREPVFQLVSRVVQCNSLEELVALMMWMLVLFHYSAMDWFHNHVIGRLQIKLS